MQSFGEEPRPLAFDVEPSEVEEKDASENQTKPIPGPVLPPKTDEYLWAWKVHLVFFRDDTELTRFYLHTARTGNYETDIFLVAFAVLS